MVLNYNGRLTDLSDLSFSTENRAFHYGDGCFESMIFFNGELQLADLHHSRLSRTCDYLSLELPEFARTQFSFEKQVKEVALANGLTHARIKLTVFREAGGYYRPERHSANFLISCSEVTGEPYTLNKKGLSIGISEQSVSTELSSYKTLNALPYVLAGIEAKKNSWDEALLKNYEGNLVEASSSNLFLITGQNILTPKLDKGGLQGVMREKVIQVLRHKGKRILELKITENDLFDADEIFLTNAVKGIQWVVSFGDKRYYSSRTREIRQSLLKALVPVS